MGYIVGENRGQITLLPESIEDYVSEDNPIRVIDIFVDNLDLDKIGIKRATAPKEGRSPYDPRDLLKIYIYGYFNKIRSSRKLMKECQRNIELMWLIRRLTPDHRTIADFRKDNTVALKNVFKAFVKLCLEMNLYNKELIAVDGSKFRAVNSKDHNYTVSKLNKRIKWIDEDVSKYITELDKYDDEEKNASEYSREELEAKIEELNLRKDLYNSYLQELKETHQTQKSIVDPESRRMLNNGKFDICYNVQTAIDSGSHMVSDFMVTNQCNDLGLLTPMAREAKKTLEMETIEAVADKGYRKQEDLLDSLKEGIVPNVFPLDGKEEYVFELEYEEKEITDEKIQSAKPEDIASCLKMGILPEIYNGKPIDIEVIDINKENNQSESISDNEFIEDMEAGVYVINEYFIRDKETDKVTCPVGYVLKRYANLKASGKIRYANIAACKNCKCKCTTEKYKTVDFSNKSDKVKSKAFAGKAGTRVIWKCPSEEMNMKIAIKKIVRITFVPDKKKLKLRKTIVEHPFGTVKRWMDASYLLLKGKAGATADLSLSFLAYNLKRAINMVGVNKLIASIQGI